MITAMFEWLGVSSSGYYMDGAIDRSWVYLRHSHRLPRQSRDRMGRGRQLQPLIDKAILMAVRNYDLAPGAIFHSDRGSNYMSRPLAETLASLDIRQSVGAPGSVTIMPWPSRSSRHSRTNDSIAQCTPLGDAP